MICWDHSMRRIVHCLSFSIEWWPTSFVMLVNLLSNADFVDIGTVETAFFLFIGNGSSCFCFLKSLFTVFLGYWICPVFEGCFVRSLCRAWKISIYRFCCSPVANIRLDGFGPFFSLTPCHCACADGGAQQSAVNKNSEVAEIGTRVFIGWWMEDVLIGFAIILLDSQ